MRGDAASELNAKEATTANKANKTKTRFLIPLNLMQRGSEGCRRGAT